MLSHPIQYQLTTLYLVRGSNTIGSPGRYLGIPVSSGTRNDCQLQTIQSVASIQVPSLSQAVSPSRTVCHLTFVYSRTHKLQRHQSDMTLLTHHHRNLGNKPPSKSELFPCHNRTSPTSISGPKHQSIVCQRDKLKSHGGRSYELSITRRARMILEILVSSFGND